jgi:predicted transcriptional regulator
MTQPTIDIELDEETRDRIETLAAARRRSAHWIMNEAIGQYLAREEAAEQRNLEADAAWEEYSETGRSVAHEAMSAWLDRRGTDREGPCPEADR